MNYKLEIIKLLNNDDQDSFLDSSETTSSANTKQRLENLQSNLRDLLNLQEGMSNDEIISRFNSFITFLKALDSSQEKPSAELNSFTELKPRNGSVGEITDDYLSKRRQKYRSNRNIEILGRFCFSLFQEVRKNPNVLEILKSEMLNDYEFLYNFFASVQPALGEVEVFAKSIHPDKVLFESKRRENRTKVSEYLSKLEGNLTVQQIAEAFRILTSDLFFGKQTYFREGVHDDTAINGIDERSGGISYEDIQEICDEYNHLLSSDMSVGVNYYRRFTDLFVHFIDLHPFFDWNGTIIMMIMLSLTSRKFGEKGEDSFEFNLKNDEMVAKIFHHNKLAILNFVRIMMNKNFLSQKRVRSIGYQKLKKFFRRRK